MAQHNFAFKARFNCACQVVGFVKGLTEPIHDLQGLLLPIGLRLNDALYKEQDVEQVRKEVVDLIRIDAVLQAEDEIVVEIVISRDRERDRERDRDRDSDTSTPMVRKPNGIAKPGMSICTKLCKFS